MGFAWSSFVAQETLLGVCARSGLPNSAALALGHPVPPLRSVFFSLATDDVMLFSRQGPGHTAAAAQRLDTAMADAGVIKHEGKDLNDSLDATCVGVDLVAGRWWWPPASKMWTLLLATIQLCESREASSAALRGYHGLIQWFDLLSRGQFAFYGAIYRESEAWDDWTRRTLPNDVLREMACSIALAVMWGVDMGLPHLPFLAATDASSEFGLGGCTASFDPQTLSSLAAFAERDGAYVTLREVIDKPRSRSLGTPHDLGVGPGYFTTIFSIRCTDNDHINIRECKALLFYVRWLLRSKVRHRHRAVVLVDSKVVVGVFCKGRSSSPTLNMWIKRIHCFCFAGGIRLVLIFVPSEHNPSDYPSRGLRLPGRRPRTTAPSKCPGCGALAMDHPMHVPKALRGKDFFCRHGFACDLDCGGWMLQADADLARLRSFRRSRAHLHRCFGFWKAVTGAIRS